MQSVYFKRTVTRRPISVIQGAARKSRTREYTQFFLRNPSISPLQKRVLPIFTTLFFWALWNILTSDWGTFSSVEKCFSHKFNNLSNHNLAPDGMEDNEKSFLCILEIPNKKTNDMDIHFLARQIVCILRTIVNLSANTNMLEVFFYYKIFRKMRR